MKRLIALAVLCAAAEATFACTGMYVGRLVSEDGTVLLGRTVDAPPWTACFRHVVTPRVENSPGRVFRSAKTRFEWPLPDTTWHYVSTPSVSSLKKGVMDSACVNERGFAVSGTVTAHSNAKIREADPFEKDGAGEDSLPGLLALCCSTVHEALDMIEHVIANRGHNGGEIYMIADKDEAWYVEVYSGHQWAAVKMPEDKVACWGNQFMIRSFDPDSVDTRHSRNLLKVAEEAGTLVRGKDGLPDLCQSYAAPLRDYSNYRTWFGHRTFAPETAGEYAESRPMPLFYSPARKVGCRDLFELMRSRYEGTRSPEETGDRTIRTIGTTKQATSHVISLDPRLPAPLRGTIWASLANCEHSVFMPLNAAMTRCDEAYSLDQAEGSFRYDPRFAGNAFRRLCALAEQNRKWYGAGVRAFWRDREDFYLSRYRELLAKSAAEWDAQPSFAAERLTSFAVEAQRRDFADARRIFDELMWYVMANNRIKGDGSGATSEPLSPFAVSNRRGQPDVVASAVSPDGRNEIRLRLDPLSYEVVRDERTAVGRSGIRLDVHGANLEATSPAVSTSRLSGRVNTPFYKKSEVALDGRETLVDFGQWAVRLVARDDGVAYRFETKMRGRVRIDGERADVTVPDADAACWANYTTRVGCEETICRTVRAQDVPIARDDARMVYLPFAYSVNGTAVVVTESDVRDYPIWNMCGGDAALGEGVCLAGRFAGWPMRECHSDGSTNRLVRGGRRVVVDKHAEWLVETDGTRTYPWRVFALADARFPAKLLESDIVYALAPAADEGVDFSWVKPGKVAWDWWNDWEGKGVTNCTTDTYFRYVDFASENGIEYVILDEGWSAKLDIWRNNPAVDVPAIIRHGREKGVGIILWMAWAQVVGDEGRVASHFAKMGAAGFKIDFLDRGDAGVARFIEKFSALCAKERMVVDYHGAYRPTGLHRRYPNVLNYEAVYGLECMKVNRGDVRILDNDVKAAFLRMTAGPLDYTPGAMDNYEIGWYPPKAVTRSHPGSVGTRCRQMAMMALYEAPLQMLCDSPTNYRRNLESLAFMAATPVTWDETRGIGGTPDSFVVLARRKGSVWYVAGMTNADGRTCEFDTSFLGGGEWSMESFRDSPRQGDPPTSYLHEKTSVRAGDRLSFKMARGGGFVARFTAK